MGRGARSDPLRSIMRAVPKDDDPTPRANGRSLAEVMAESARLKRQSAEMLKRIADLDEQIAARLPLSAPKRPRRKQ